MQVQIYINTSVLSYFGANLIIIIHTAKKNYTKFIFVYNLFFLIPINIRTYIPIYLFIYLLT